MVQNRRTTRRVFLRGAGGVAIALPLLPSLQPRSTWAQAAAPGPRRMLTMFSPNGFHRDVFLPSGGETDFQLSTVLQPLSPFRDRIMVLHNLHGAFDQHDMGTASCMTEANGQGPSIDQVVATQLGQVTRLKSLEVSAQNWDANSGKISYVGPGLPVPPIPEPRVAFDRVVGASVSDPVALERGKRQSTSVLDMVMGDLADVSGRLSPGERVLLDAHLSEIRDLEQRIADAPPAKQCDVPEPPVVEGDAVADPTLFPEVVRLQIDNVVLALRCDVARVVTVTLGKSEQEIPFSWLGIQDGTHGIAHLTVADAITKKGQVDGWYAAQLAYLMQRLSEIPDGDGTTLLDNCGILWTNELGMYTDQAHSRANCAVVIAGACGGYFHTGRLLDMQQRPYADMLMSMADAMGVTLTEFGVDGTSPIDELRA